MSDKQKPEKCGQPAASLIPRWGWSFACVLKKGHKGEHKQGGNCIRHGEYIGAQCPKWPECAKPPGEKVQPGMKAGVLDPILDPAYSWPAIRSLNNDVQLVKTEPQQVPEDLYGVLPTVEDDMAVGNVGLENLIGMWARHGFSKTVSALKELQVSRECLGVGEQRAAKAEKHGVFIVAILALVATVYIIGHFVVQDDRETQQSDQQWADFSRVNHCKIAHDSGLFEATTLWQCDGFQVQR